MTTKDTPKETWEQRWDKFVDDSFVYEGKTELSVVETKAFISKELELARREGHELGRKEAIEFYESKVKEAKKEAVREVVETIEDLKITGDIGGEGVMEILKIGSKEMFHNAEIHNNALDKVLATLREDYKLDK